MKILQVNTADIGGGAESSAWNLHREYLRRGLISWLVVGSKKREHQPEIIEIPREKRNQLLSRSKAKTLVPSQINYGSSRLLSRLRNYYLTATSGRQGIEVALGIEDFNFPDSKDLLALTPEKPDIVHLHNLHGDYFDLRILTRLSQNVPVILNLRDMWLLTGHCAVAIDCDRWRNGCGNCPDLSIYPEIRRDATAYNWWRKKRIFRKSRIYLSAPSSWLLDRATFSMFDVTMTKVIPNGIDLAVFKPKPRVQSRKRLGLPLESTIILLTAHNDFKDLDTMRSALASLNKRPSSEYLYICLGIDKPVEHLGTSKLLFKGYEANQEEMAHYYNAADLFLYAGYAEAFGKTIVEAMACGLPVVATRAGAVSETVVDGVTGYLTNTSDSQELSLCIEKVLSDNDLKHSMGKAGIQRARDLFSLDNQVSAFISWYQEVIEDWRSATGSLFDEVT